MNEDVTSNTEVTRAGNPAFKKGGPSPNPKGRGKNSFSARTVRGSVERFIKRHYSPQKLATIMDKLSAKDKATLYVELLSYVIPKQSAMSVKAEINSLPGEAIEELYKRITGATEDISFTEPLQLPEPIKQTA